ncbi:MAG: hypothetical protein EAZ89_13145 [Bacteroidetes bacterium]|nr:MAG: hypothetical protein EAZ89_13145 [Bacteroidota bacterium]
MQRILLTILLGLAFGLAQAQSHNMEDVVYLKNGWIIRGTIKQIIPDSVLTIESEGRNVFVFKWEEVLRMAQEEAPRRRGGDRGPAAYPEKHYYGTARIAVLAGSNASTFYYGNNGSMSLQTSHGYRFSHWLQAGVGTDITFYNNGLMLPLYGELRSDLKAAAVSPQLYVKGGYSLPLYQNASDPWGGTQNYKAYGGINMEAGVGMRLQTHGPAAWLLSAGYHMQAKRDTYTNWGGAEIEENYVFRRLSIAAGIIF